MCFGTLSLITDNILKCFTIFEPDLFWTHEQSFYNIEGTVSSKTLSKKDYINLNEKHCQEVKVRFAFQTASAYNAQA